MQVGGFQLKVERNVLYTFIILVVIFGLVTGVLSMSSGDNQDLSIIDVLLISIAAALFHYVAQLFHMVGHAVAARMTGYPMSGIWLLYVFAMSLYPSDEPELSAKIHIQRSLGGVVAFGLLWMFVAAQWLAFRDLPFMALRYLTTYMLVNVSLLFAVSALISDGMMFIVRKEWQTTE